MTSAHPDRLYELLPVVHRLRDADRGYPLRALLKVITEQVDVVDRDIAQLYENWFVETCQDWVVPYIGDLIGYASPFVLGEPTCDDDARARLRGRILVPRREVANVVRLRRRKGTLAVLEDLAAAVAGWPGRAVEFYRLLGVNQNINYLQMRRGKTADLRDGEALDDLGSAFEEIAHSVDVRSIRARHFREFFNIPSVGVFVWRLKTYSVTDTPAYCEEQESPNCFVFSVLGNDTPLYNRARTRPAHPPGKLDLPTPITRRLLERFEIREPIGQVTSGLPYYYGPGKSFSISTGSSRTPVDPNSIVVADLTDWIYRPLPGQVAVDPQLGRIAFPPTQTRRQSVWVTYHYAFSADMGGGEYARQVSQPPVYNLYLVGQGETFPRINDALARWKADAPVNAVIEITDSGVYVEPISITLKPGQTLQLRAASGRRPVIRLLNWQTSGPDNLTIVGERDEKAPDADPTSWFTLDGIVVTGRGVQVQGAVAGVTIRHSTLVPGWGIDRHCRPTRPTEPSLVLDDAPVCVRIEHSIVGAIQVNRDEVREDPVQIYINDSIVDATSEDAVAVGAPEQLCAFSVLSIRRSTVFGQVQTHAVSLAENSIFMGVMTDCRRQLGCMRFCYVPAGSRTPKRFACQPDMVERDVLALAKRDGLTGAQQSVLIAQERQRVEPQFDSVRYGTPTYARLSEHCAEEIVRGADDESEMGVFHDLYQPQRAASLRARLDEYTPAGMTAGVVYAS
jgi:hypothetical protein